jgi:iron complex outermembrane recepter protein
MYASHSPGGVMNVVTAAPKTDRYSANASLEYGSYNLINSQFAVNAPIIKELLAMRLAGQIYKRDSFIYNDRSQDTKSARLKTLFQPNDNFSATVTINYAKKINGGMMGGQVIPFDYQDGYWYRQSGPNGPWSKISKVTNPWTTPTTAASPPGVPMQGPNKAGQITKGITGEINWNSALGSLTVVPQYSRTTSNDQGNYTYNNLNYIVYTSMKSYQKGMEARMTSASDSTIKWIVGANYYKQHKGRYSTYNQPGIAEKKLENWGDTKAVFGNVTYPLTSTFRGNGGLRQSWDKIRNVELPAVVKTGKSGQDYSSPDYKLGFEYDLIENSMLYGTYATSYRVNGMVVNQGPKTAEPEKLKAYTAGVKNRLFENKLQLNASGYLYFYENKRAYMNNEGRLVTGQVVYEDDLIGADGQMIDANGNGIRGEHVQLSTGAASEDPWVAQFGAFRSIGVDISADWVLTPKDKMTLGVSYLNTKWTDMTYEFYFKRKDGSKFWPSDGVDYSGFKNSYSPTWTVTSSYEHNFELGTYGMLVPHIDFLYKSEYNMDFRLINYPMSIQEPYYFLNGSLTFTSMSGKWSLNAYVKNATNYAVKNFWSNQGGTYTLGVGDPRTFGGVISLKY